MRVPTVRVKHPSGDGSMLINVEDLRDHHEMLPLDEQDDQFDPSTLYQPLKALPVDAALRDLAAALFLEMVADRYDDRADPEAKKFASLTDEEKLAHLKTVREEYVEAKERVLGRQREELEERLREQASQTPPPEATDVPDLVPNTNQMDEGKQLDQSGAQDAGQSGQQSGQSLDKPEVEEPVLPLLKIENARGYFYVMADGEKVSKGHREIADARADLDELVAEGKGRKPATTESE